MYEVLNDFLKIPYWHKMNPSDELAFFAALGSLVAEKTFDPNDMGKYMAEQSGLPQTTEAIQHYVTYARTMKKYFEANPPGRHSW